MIVGTAVLAAEPWKVMPMLALRVMGPRQRLSPAMIINGASPNWALPVPLRMSAVSQICMPRCMPPWTPGRPGSK